MTGKPNPLCQESWQTGQRRPVIPDYRHEAPLLTDRHVARGPGRTVAGPVHQQRLQTASNSCQISSKLNA